MYIFADVLPHNGRPLEIHIMRGRECRERKKKSLRIESLNLGCKKGLENHRKHGGEEDPSLLCATSVC